MGKNSKEKDFLLQESKNELLLKTYFNKLNEIVGEDYSSLTLTSDGDIKKSLSMFSSKFNDVENEEIVFILLKSAMLSNDDNYYNNVVKEKISLGDISTIVYLVEENLGFRRSLTKTFIKQSNKSNKELYDNVLEKENVLRDISTLNFYEENLKERKLEKPFLKLKA